jgi:hypothetical protein
VETDDETTTVLYEMTQEINMSLLIETADELGLIVSISNRTIKTSEGKMWMTKLGLVVRTVD